jgi:hypothetical protein
MNQINTSLQAMGVEQYLMAFVFLASYSLALSQFIGSRGRLYAALAAVVSAIAFARFTDPWENGVLVIAFTLVAMGLFAGTVWALWAVFGWSHTHHVIVEEPLPAQSGGGTLRALAAALAVLRRAGTLARAGHPQR